MSKQYTREQFDQDKFLVKLAQSQLSARVAGHSGIELEKYASQYKNIALLFDPDVNKIKTVGFMFADLMMDGRLGGFKCMEYEKLLKLVLKKIQSKMFFRRKKKITCFLPNEHRQPCYCARMAAAKAVVEAVADDRDEVATRMSGVLALEQGEAL